jgi:tetratricopeptide (TPR) repeat protein
MKLRRLAMTVAGLVCLAATSLAQIATIQGTVIGTDGKPIVGAIIKIHRTDVKFDAQTKSDKRGHYIYAGLPLAGMFDISCIVDGKEVDKLQGVRSEMGDHPDTDIDLRKLVTAASANRQAMVNQALQTGQIPDELNRTMTPEQKAVLEKQMLETTGKIKKQNALNNAFNEGVAALQAKQYDMAVTALEKAGEVDPKQPAVWANLADAYAGQAGKMTGAEFDQTMAKAIADYEKSIDLKPDEAGTHNNYGLALAKIKKYPEAETELKKAAELDPPNAFSKYFNLGATLNNIGQTDEAAKAFKMAIDAAPDNPKNAGAYYQYGLILVGQATMKDNKIVPPPGTAEAFQKYLQLAPDGPYAAAAKDTLRELGGSVQTTFQNPNAPAPKTKK